MLILRIHFEQKNSNHYNDLKEIDGIKVAYYSIEVTIETTYNNVYGGYFSQSSVPTLDTLGITGTLLAPPIISSFYDKSDRNIQCSVKMNPNDKYFSFSSILESRTIVVYFVFLYK